MPVRHEPIARLVDVREELLAQHRVLRTLAAAVQRSVERVGTDARSLARLRHELLTLAHALGRHIAYEEHVLRGVLARIDAWGPARSELLGAQHRDEHAAMRAAIAEAATTDDPVALARTSSATVAMLLEHMAVEEADVLAEDAFRDEVYARDAFGG